jgi:hypothetical protein
MEKPMARKAALILFAALIAVAAKKPVPVAPGTYEHWGPDIDRIEIVKTFDHKAYSRLVVAPLDTTGVKETGDADLEKKVDAVLSVATESLIDGIHKEAPALTVVEAESSDAADALLLRAKVTVMDPGSRSKRMWIGYGAGAARAAIEGELVDAGTGEVLVRFTQERLSGIERFGKGSSYEEIMKRNLAALGRDVVRLVNVF